MPEGPEEFPEFPGNSEASFLGGPPHQLGRWAVCVGATVATCQRRIPHGTPGQYFGLFSGSSTLLGVLGPLPYHPFVSPISGFRLCFRFREGCGKKMISSGLRIS